MFSAATKCPTILRSFVTPAKVGIVVLAVFLALDRGVVVADTSAETCSSGIAVTNPEDNPLLVQDCEALLEARDILSQGGRRLVWSADTSMSKWEGLSIHGSPARVRGLWLGGDGGGKGSLKGSIPAALGRLTGLLVLELDSNGLTGEIPDALGQLNNLHTLELNSNELVGEIPAEFGRLTNLQRLRLFDNQLTGKIPPELGRLANLERLWLSGNQLSGEIPEELDALTELTWLQLRGNRLTGRIPVGLGRLTNLEMLDLAYNDLTGSVPAELGELYGLEGLDLGNNELTGGVPPELGKLHSLEVLQLHDNKLSGQIPGEIGLLAKLRLMWLNDNELTGAIPGRISKLSQLVGLNLGNNKLTGEIPVTIAELTKLESLRLGGNQLTGEIPVELAGLFNLESLGLDGNQLTGAIPEELGSLAKLFSLGLRDNQLTGAIPPVLGDLTDLWGLFLSGNMLTGEIPASLGQLASLTYLELSDNRLTGEIPAALVDLTNLLGLLVQGNDLTGCVPLALSRFDAASFEDTSLRFCFAIDDHPTTVETPAQLTVAEESEIRIDESVLLANDMETENYTLRITDVGDAVNGTVSLAVSTIAFSHDGSETTSGSFTYTASDGVHSSIATATIAVTPVNDPPVAVDDSATVDEGDTLTIEASELLDNDTDAENDTLAITLVGDGVNGTVLLDGMTIIYEHDGSETTSGSFSYTMSDGTVTDTATVELAVAAVNDPPVAVGDSATVDEGDTLFIEASALLDNDTDAENDTLAITSVGNGVNGTVLLDGVTITYEHDGSETTSGSFSYTMSDGTVTETATVELAVVAVNDPPVAVADMAAVNEGDTISIEASVLLENDTDAENDTLAITSVGDGVNGTVLLNGMTITYEHDGSETTSGSFAYTLSDGTDTSTAMATITVTPVNDPPIAVGDTATVEEGDTLSIEASVLLDNDTDAENDTLSINSVGKGVNGMVLLDGMTITYEHDGSETTTGSFTYTISDGTDTFTATATITVTPVNDPPIAVVDSATVDEGDTLSIEASALLDNDTDAENDTLSITSVGDGVNGTVLLDGMTITYEHDGSETTTGSFTYTISDGTDTSTAMATITVNPVNDLPVGPLVALVLGAGVLSALVLLVLRRRRRSSK